MTIPRSHLWADELTDVGHNTTEPLLHALEVAIYVEETLAIVLPDAALDDASLGTPQAVILTVATMLGGR